jgi:Yip1 domain
LQHGYDSKSIDASNVFNNPLAKRILQLITRKGWATFKELQETLQMNTETVHQQLVNLDGLVSRGPGQRYRLTKEGEIVASSLKLRGAFSPGPVQTRKRESGLRFALNELLFGRSLLERLNARPEEGLPFSILILGIGGLVSYMTNLEPILLFYINPRSGIGQSWFVLLFPVGWFITFAVADFLSHVFFHRTGGDLRLVNGSAIAMLPLLLVPGLVFLINPFSTIIQSATTLTILIQVAVQIWVVCLLSNAIATAKGLKMERTALISITVMYLNVAAVLFALQLGFF